MPRSNRVTQSSPVSLPSPLDYNAQLTALQGAFGNESPLGELKPLPQSSVFDEQVAKQKREASTTTGDYVESAIRQDSPIDGMVAAYVGSQYKPDPNYNPFDPKQLEEDSKGLPEEFKPELLKAVSAEHRSTSARAWTTRWRICAAWATSGSRATRHASSRASWSRRTSRSGSPRVASRPRRAACRSGQDRRGPGRCGRWRVRLRACAPEVQLRGLAARRGVGGPHGHGVLCAVRGAPRARDVPAAQVARASCTARTSTRR
jgi:hypothetical protein